MLRDDLDLVPLAALSGGAQTVVLCHSVRLASDLRRAHGMALAAQGHGSWRALQTATPTLWLDHLCSGALLRGEIPPETLPGLFLSARQERSLWESAIRTDTERSASAAELFDISGLARAAIDADSLSQVWRLNVPDALQTEECRAFLRWQAKVLAICQKNGWCTASQTLAWRTDCIKRGVTGLPERVGVAGFAATDPAMLRLLQALESRGVALFRVDLAAAQVARRECRVADDAEAECVAAAQWAAALVRCDNADANGKPTQLRIAVADLPVRRRMVDLALARALHPERLGAGWAGHEADYQILGGETLVDQPLVDVGLRLMQLVVHSRRLSLADFGELLCGLGWSSDLDEAEGRARLDVQLREMLPPETTFDRVYRAVSAAHDRLPIATLVQHLDQLLNASKALRSQPKRQVPSNWAAQFLTLLELSYWPGQRPLVAAEVAACHALRECVSELAALDSVLGRVDAGEALRQLQRQCRDQVFQAPRRGLVRVEVCSIADALAAPVDGLWVMGLNEAAWPQAAQPNPLLPSDLQRRIGIPIARAESQRVLAEEMQSLLQSNATQVVFSWAARDGERELRPSALLASVTQVGCSANHALQESTTNATDATNLLERLLDARAPAMTDGEIVRGGTRVLQAQAICPAWGFYQFRLGVSVLPAPTGGLDALARGSLLHATLEAFWRGRSHADLLAMDEAIRTSLVTAAVDHALDAYDRTATDALRPRMRQLEKMRLVALVMEWLKVEVQRAPFRVVACEKRLDCDIAGLKFRAVIDRVDQIDDGRMVVIDYKAGRNVSTSSWAEPRISQPQVPIYVTQAFGGQTVAAAVLARVTLDKPGFLGVAEDDGLLPQVKSLNDLRKLYPAHEFADFVSLRQRWDQRLRETATEFKEGCAAVVFKTEQSVENCDVRALLRIAERRMQFEEQQSHDGKR